MRKIVMILLILTMAITLAVPAFAANEAEGESITLIRLSAEGYPLRYIPELDWVVIREYETRQEYTIERATGEKIDAEYDAVSSFSEGLAIVEKRYRDGDAWWDKKYGYIDETGSIVVPLEYDYVGIFSEGLAAVGKLTEGINPVYSTSRNTGYIDASGTVVIPLKYTSADPFSDGLACTSSDDGYSFIDKSGNIVFSCESDPGSFSEGLVRCSWKNNYGEWKEGYVDTTGKVIISPEYDSAGKFSDGLAQVKLNGKYGYIDSSGNVVVPLVYDYVGDFSDGLVWVGKKRGYGYIYGFVDKTGTEVIPLQYSAVGSFSNGLAPARDDEGWGYIDQTGAYVISPEYSEAEEFVDGIAPVCKETNEENVYDEYEHWGFINQTGAVVVPFEYDDAGIMEGGLAWVEKIDEAGNSLLGFFEIPENVGTLSPVDVGALPPADIESPEDIGSPEDVDFIVERDTNSGISSFSLTLAIVIGVVVVTGTLVCVLQKRKKAVASTSASGSSHNQSISSAQPFLKTPEAKQMEPNMPKFCSNCGSPLTPGCKFCSECGHSIWPEKG